MQIQFTEFEIQLIREIIENELDQPIFPSRRKIFEQLQNRIDAILKNIKK